MNAGLIITHTSTLKTGMAFYNGALWTPERGAQSALSHLAKTPADAVQAFLTRWPGIAWLSGPAATKRLAIRFCLAYRKRAPGGGRKKTAIEAKAVYVPVWMTPPGRDRLDFLRGKRPRGAFIEAHLPLMK